MIRMEEKFWSLIERDFSEGVLRTVYIGVAVFTIFQFVRVFTV